jgi:ABC-type lipoprotein export system ATPase subunit
MDMDLTPLAETEDENVVTTLMTPLPSDSVQDGSAIIVAEGLSKHFTHKGGIIKAVDNVSFTFRERQFITIVGPSGSGKSTLLYLLGGLDEVTSGKLLVDGVDIEHLSEQQEHQYRRWKVGFIFQSFHLLPNLTALENVMLPMQLAGDRPPAQIRASATELLLEVGISEDRHHHKPGKLSGGQQQRVAIARALANDARVILADEPTGNLDSRTSKRIVDLLKNLSEQGKTVIVVTHDRSIALIADVRLEMEDGKLKLAPKYIGSSDTSIQASTIKCWENLPVTVVAEGLCKHFKHHGRVIKAVDEATFTFHEQQFITITGPSGSGKSTLLYIISGLDKVTKGELQLDGVNVKHLVGRKENRFRRQKIGFVFQSFHLISNLTALENVMLPMELLGGKSPAEMRERARLLLFQAGINEDRHHHRPGKLSGGQQQRVAIARALANDPKVIIADEPTGNLDLHNGKRIIELLKNLSEQGKTVIVVTHDRSIAKEADLRLEMDGGRLKGTSNVVATTHSMTQTQRKKGRKK